MATVDRISQHSLNRASGRNDPSPPKVGCCHEMDRPQPQIQRSRRPCSVGRTRLARIRVLWRAPPVRRRGSVRAAAGVCRDSHSTDPGSDHRSDAGADLAATESSSSDHKRAPNTEHRGATSAATTASAVPVTTTPAIVTEFNGTFVGRDHPTSGTAIVLGDGSGQRFLRFEEFETDNGPDLNVYLVNSSAGGVDDFIDLGNLKGNIGDQNYEIPADADLETYDTVLIWCVRFASPFGEATLTPS